MSNDAWYVARAGQRCGPFRFAQMVNMAREGTLHPLEMVTQGTSEEWRTAQSVPSLWLGTQEAVLPKKTASAPTPVQDPEEMERRHAWAQVRQTAEWFRRANLIALAAIAVEGGALLAGIREPIVVVVTVTLSIGLLFALVLMAKDMHFYPWFWAIIGLIPLANLLALLLLANRGSHYLSKRGFEVGMIGPSLAETPDPQFVRDARLGWKLQQT